MERFLSLRLIHTRTENEIEKVDVYLDPERKLGEYYAALRRHFFGMASRNAEEQVRADAADMPWLLNYHLLVCESDNPNDVIMKFREA